MTPRNRKIAAGPDPNATVDARFGKRHREIRRSERKSVRVLVAGQLPPPVCGQNLNIARVLGMLQCHPRIRAEHWAFRFTPSWAKVRRAGAGKVLELVRVWGRLLKLRAAGRIDAILYPVGGPHLTPVIRDLCLLPLALLCSRRVILHFRAAGFAEALPRFPSPVRALAGKLYRACGEAVVLTDYGRRDPEAAGIAREKIAVIPNACEDRFRREWRKETDPGGAITILNVGLHCPDKGTPALVEAFSRLARDRKNVRLRLVGESMGGTTAESLSEIAARHGVSSQLELSGVLRGNALDRAYAEADLFVFSSVAPFESFGMVLIESMMWELPIVATDWRGNAEVLGENPGGKLAATGKELAGSLEFAMEEALERTAEWREWGRRNRNRYREHFRIGKLETRLGRLLIRS